MKKAPQSEPRGVKHDTDIINHYPDKSKHIKRLEAIIEAFFIAAAFLLGTAGFISLLEIVRLIYGN